MGGCFGKGALLPGDGERTPAEDEYRVADAEGEGADLVVDSKSASSGEDIPDENYDGPPSTAAATAKGKASSSSSATAAASKSKKAGPAAAGAKNSTLNKPRARSANPATTSAGGGSSSASARVVPRSTTPSPIAMVAQLTPAWIRGGGGRPRDADLSVILPPGVEVDPPSGAASSSATSMSRSRSASAGAAAGGPPSGGTGGGSSLRQATAKAPKGASGGSTATSALSDGDSTRQMFDRNTLRLMPQWAPVFSGCLAKIRKTGFENFFDDTFVSGGASSRSGGEPKTTVAQAIAAGTTRSTSPNPAKPNEQTGGSSASSSSGGNKASVRIFCRKRPLFQKERDQGHYDCIHVVGGGSATAASLSGPGATQSSKYVAASVCNFEPDLKTPYIQHHGFVFDHAFDENATNDDVFRYFLEKELFFSSFSAPSAQQGALGTTRLGAATTQQKITTLFMLGQTGSGKTHTMTAIEERAAVEIFKAKTNCKVTFVELRGNKVFDLLYKGRSASEVSIREVSGGKYLVQGAEVRECNTAIELQNWMKTGHDRRKTEQTGVNDTSSRSHAVITITMQPFDSKLILVDAAGTERAKDQMAHSKERLEETAEINASLYALKECIRQHGKQEIPSHLFRQSTLTKILADSFQKPKGGSTGQRGTTSGANAGASALDQDSRLIGVIVTVSPNVTDVEHSLTTLRAGFGMKNPTKSQTHSVKQVNLKQFLGEKELRFIAVNRWTPSQVEEWVGSFNTQVKFPGGTTGTMLSRFPLARFEQTFGKKLGAKMFASVKAENETPTIFSYEVE